MTTLARFYCQEDREDWDAFVASSPYGNLLYTRRFLDYHGERLADLSMIVEDEAGEWLAVIPAAAATRSPTLAISHPGATFGGVCTRRATTPDELARSILHAARLLLSHGFEELQIRAAPQHISVQPSGSLDHLLWRLGARATRCDLWSIIDLRAPRRMSKGRRWGMNRAVAAGVTVGREHSEAAHTGFHELLAKTLMERHGVAS